MYFYSHHINLKYIPLFQNEKHLKFITKNSVLIKFDFKVKSLQCEIFSVRNDYAVLNEEYQNLLGQFKCLEKKKLNLEKFYLQVNSENGELQDLKIKLENELCEVKNQNALLKEKILASSKDSSLEDNKALHNKVRELTMKVSSAPCPSSKYKFGKLIKYF